MILLTAKLIKIVLALAFIAAGVLWLRKNKTGQKMERSAVVRLCVLWIVLVGVFAAAANIVAGYIPPLKDSIFLTALGEKNEAAGAEEVFFNGFTVDGEKVLLDAPEEGKWFWYGDEALCWRIETDSRQPEGMTRSITVMVPVGWSRTANFLSNEWRGLVEIRTDQEAQVIDTYAEKAGIVSVELGQSKKSVLIWNQVRKLAVYFVVLVLLGIATLAIIRWALNDQKRARAWLNRNWGKLIYGGISCVTFGLMIRYADRASFWYDELAQVGITKGTIGEAIALSLSATEPVPPLTEILLTIWYHIAPYGERWLLLLSIVSVTAAIYVIGLTGEKLEGKTTGIFAVIFCASNSAVWTMQALEYRAYPLVMLFSSLTLYFYVERNASGQAVCWRVLYSIALLCLGTTHYFGMLLCGMFFLADVYLYVKKRIKWQTVFNYLVPGLVCSILVINLFRFVGAYDGSWAPKPTLTNVIALLHTLSGGTEAMYLLLILGLCTGVAASFFQRDSGSEWLLFYREFFSWTIIGVISLLVFYGTAINPKSAMFNARYFLVMLPEIMLLMANITEQIIERCLSIRMLNTGAITVMCMCIGIILYSGCVSTVSEVTSSQPYREASEYIYKQINDIFSDNTLIITNSGNLTTAGWQEYYISKQGKRDPLNVSGWSISGDEMKQYKKLYFQYGGAATMGNELKSNLNKYFSLVEDNTKVKVRVYERK